MSKYLACLAVVLVGLVVSGIASAETTVHSYTRKAPAHVSHKTHHAGHHAHAAKPAKTSGSCGFRK